MEEKLTESPPSQPDAIAVQCTADHDRLTDSDKALIWHLAQDKRSQAEIAHIVGCHRSSVSRWLTKLNPTDAIAEARAHHRALEVGEAAIDGSIEAARAGRPEHALEVADRLGFLKKRQAETARGVTILVGMEGRPAGPDPFIEVSPAAFASDAPRQGAGSD